MGWIRTSILLLLLVTAPFPAADAQAPMQPAGPSLFSDIRSYQVDDILTIVISEVSRGVNEARTNQDKDHHTKFSVGPGKGFLDALDVFGLDMDNELEYDANASTSRNNVLQARLTAVVREVAANGNLIVEGHKTIQINGESQEITLTGIVRPVDIRPDNTVLSSKVADMSIGFSGKGTVTAGSSPGILARIFHFIF